MEEVNYNELREFIDCPLKYKFMKNDSITPDEENIDEYILNEALRDTFIEFYRQIDEKDKVLSFEDLKRVFSNFYNEGEEYDDIVHKMRTSYVRYIKHIDAEKYIDVARKSLRNFAERYEDDPGIPLGYNWDFTLNFFNLKVKGKIPVVRKRKNDIEIFVPFYSKVRINNYLKDNYFELPLLLVAFNNLVKEKGLEDIIEGLDVKLLVYKANEDKEKVAEINERRIKASLYQINNIACIIKNDLFFKSVGKPCKRCGYQKYCAGWTPKIDYLN